MPFIWAFSKLGMSLPFFHTGDPENSKCLVKQQRGTAEDLLSLPHQTLIYDGQFVKWHIFLLSTVLFLLTLGGKDLAHGAEEPERKWGDGLDMFALHEAELGANVWRGQAMCKTCYGHDEERKDSEEARSSATLFG